MAKNISDSSWKINIEEIKVKLIPFPKKNADKLTIKIGKAVTSLLESAERWQMIHIDIKKLESSVAKIQSGKKKHTGLYDTPLSSDEAQHEWTLMSIAIRDDFSLENFKAWNICGYNFCKLDKQWNSERDTKWNPKIAACIYSISGVEKILLLRSLAEDPLHAKDFLALLRRKIDKKNKEKK